MRYKCVCTYDGYNYCGWQRQKVSLHSDNRVYSIQYTIERALSKLYASDIKVHASSRTDSGVHALHQVFHYDVGIEIPIKNLLLAVNNLLPLDIRILSVELVEDSFHARYNTKSKTYKYLINTGKYNVFSSKYIYQYCKNLDLKIIEQSIPFFVKRLDFKALMASGSDKVNSIREIKNIDYEIVNDNLVSFEIKADGFLYHMVRIIIGSFIRLSNSEISLTEMEEALIKGDRNIFKFTAPSNGLYLIDIEYYGD